MSVPSVLGISITYSEIPATFIGEDSAILRFETNDYAISTVDYGTSTNYGLQITRNEYSRTHVYDLKGLQPGMTYHYRITIVDKSGNTIQSNDATFTTSASSTTITIPPQHITTPQTLSQSNVKYVLSGDITAETSAFIITGSNVVFDLNGFTITYDTYQNFPYSLNIPNGDFESGDLTGWTASPSNGWRIEGDNIRPFEGKWHVVMNEPPQNGAQIISPWAYLPTNTEAIAGYFTDTKAGDWSASNAADCITKGCPRIRFEVEREDGTIVKSWDDIFYWGNKNSFNTNADSTPQRYRIKYTLVQWNGPANSFHDDAAYDSFHILPRNNYAIDSTGTNVEIKDGIIIQGRGSSVEGHAVRLEGNQNKVRRTTINVIGNEARAVLSTGGDNLISENIITSTSSIKYNRNLLGGPISLQYSPRTLVYNNQITSGSDSAKPWNAIHVDNANGASNNVDIAYNNVSIKTTLTNHHAITCWMCDNARVYNNKITTDPGQGILFSGDPPAMVNAKIYDNTITILSQEPNEEYSTFSQDAIRLNDYGGNGCDAWIDGNNITVYGDFNDYYRTGYPTNTQVVNGIITGCNVGNATVSNNYVKAIRVDTTGVLVSAIEPTGGVGTNISYKNNYLESNNNIITFGGYKDHNDGIIIENNTLVKGVNPISFNTIYSRNRRPYVNGVRIIDSKLQGGASLDTSSIFLESIQPNYEFFIDYTVNLRVLDSNS